MIVYRSYYDLMSSSETKKGGPYTKQEQEERRKKVYEMHFEHGKSAVKIAEKLGVNRNTINDDIKFLYSQISQEIGGKNLGLSVIATMHRFELQRSRLLEEIEKTNKFEDRMKIESMLYNIESKLGSMATHILTNERRTIVPDYTSELDEISEDEIKEFVRDLVFKSGKGYAYQENIEGEYIRKTKCNTNKSSLIMKKLVGLGLDFFKTPLMRDFGTIRVRTDRYNIDGFALARGYITEKELARLAEETSNID